MDSHQSYQKSHPLQGWQPTPGVYQYGFLHHPRPEMTPDLYQEPSPPYSATDNNSPLSQPSQPHRQYGTPVPRTQNFQVQSAKYEPVPQARPAATLQPPLYPTSNLSRPSFSYSQSSSSQPLTDEAFHSEALAFTQNTSRVPFHITRLNSPIAIPQTTSGLGASFLRTWATALQSYNISILEFIAFIDNLNVISTASPPLQVLDLAGGVIGMVPHHWAMIAGNAIQLTAKLGVAAVSKGRTEMYMREMNEKMFKPRGLKASIASTQAMRSVLHVPGERRILGPLNAQTMNMSTAERVLVEIQPYNGILDLNVPPPTEQTTTLAKMSAIQVAKQSKKNQEKLVKSRENATQKDEKREGKEEKKQEKRQRKEEKKASNRERKHKAGRSNSDNESDSEEERDGHRKKSDKQGRREEKSAEKLLWILIENL